jgi:hypothetical protein
MAYKWPGDDAGPGGAVAAKVIGLQCPDVLSASDIGELDAYLAKAASEWAKRAETQKKSGDRSPSLDTIIRGLTETYTKKYRDPKACDADATEAARDMLQRVRRAMAAGMPLYPDGADPDRKPDTGEAITAKVTGEKCLGALTALELAELELYVAKYWVWFAKNATDADARLNMQVLKSAENKIASGFRSAKDCTAEAVERAKDVAARAHKAEAGKAR